jgi:hypothetical protein
MLQVSLVRKVMNMMAATFVLIRELEGSLTVGALESI